MDKQPKKKEVSDLTLSALFTDTLNFKHSEDDFFKACNTTKQAMFGLIDKVKQAVPDGTPMTKIIEAAWHTKAGMQERLVLLFLLGEMKGVQRTLDRMIDERKGE